MKKTQVIREIDNYRYLYLESLMLRGLNLPIIKRIVNGELYKKSSEIASHFGLDSLSIDDISHIITSNDSRHEPSRVIYDRICRECEL